MRILQVIPVFSAFFGGPVSVVRSISKELAKRHEVTIYTTSALDHKRDFKSSTSEVESDGYRVVYFPRIFRFSGFNLSPTMIRALQENLREYDIIHLHSWRQFQDVIVHRYAMKYSVPYVVQTHGSLPRMMAKRRLKWIYDTFFGYELLKDASEVIALTQMEAEQYLRIGIPKEKIEIIPNGIDLSEYADLPLKGSFKNKFNIPDDKKIILYLGRIHRTKGIDLLVKSYDYLVKKMKYNDVILVIVGQDDGFLDEIKSLVSSLSISNSVVITGYVKSEDKLGALVDANVFVTPSFHGFPITFLEACITGTPIVTTILGDILEWIDGNVGYITLPTSFNIAEAICRIISSDKLHNKYSKNCIQIVKSNFSIENVVNKLEKIYMQLI